MSNDTTKSKWLYWRYVPYVRTFYTEKPVEPEYPVESDEEIEQRYLQSLDDKNKLSTIKVQRRRARKLALPDTWTNGEWNRCLIYWHNKCAVCSYPLKDVFGNVPHADHWIPLSYKGAGNPGTVAANMICLCSACNFSKNAKMPVRWLKLKYDDTKVSMIVKRITAYFEWVKMPGDV